MGTRGKRPRGMRLARGRLSRGRGLVLLGLITVFAGGIALDHYLQTRARLPRGELRRESAGPASSLADATPPRESARPRRRSDAIRFDPDAGTELRIRIGGTRIPDLPSGAFGTVPPASDARSAPPVSGGIEGTRTAPPGDTGTRELHDEGVHAASGPADRRGTTAPPGSPGAASDGQIDRANDREALRPEGGTLLEQERVHRVRPNETLSEIALEYGLRGPNGWRRIQQLNGIEDPTRLRAGDEIRIPPP